MGWYDTTQHISITYILSYILQLVCDEYLHIDNTFTDPISVEMMLNIGRRDVLDAGKEPEGSFEYFCQLARPADGQVRALLVLDIIKTSV